MIKFNCPYCEQSLEAEDDSRGDSSPCPSCGKTVYVVESASAVRSRSNPPIRATSQQPGLADPIAKMGRMKKALFILICVLVGPIALFMSLARCGASGSNSSLAYWNGIKASWHYASATSIADEGRAAIQQAKAIRSLPSAGVDKQLVSCALRYAEMRDAKGRYLLSRPNSRDPQAVAEADVSFTFDSGKRFMLCSWVELRETLSARYGCDFPEIVQVNRPNAETTARYWDDMLALVQMAKPQGAISAHRGRLTSSLQLLRGLGIRDVDNDALACSDVWVAYFESTINHLAQYSDLSQQESAEEAMRRWNLELNQRNGFIEPYGYTEYMRKKICVNYGIELPRLLPAE
jgi:hypothetical protein